jgi:2-iminobutanoate/2-iminopropanoate deaminase
VGNVIYTSGQVATDATGATVGSDIKTQTACVMQKIKESIEAFGGHVKDIVKCTVFLTDISMFAGMNEVYIKFFQDNGVIDSLPARSAMEISKLVKPEWIVEIEAIAIKD